MNFNDAIGQFISFIALSKLTNNIINFVFRVKNLMSECSSQNLYTYTLYINKLQKPSNVPLLLQYKDHQLPSELA